jgi:hypothetical protein
MVAWFASGKSSSAAAVGVAVGGTIVGEGDKVSAVGGAVVEADPHALARVIRVIGMMILEKDLDTGFLLVG